MHSPPSHPKLSAPLQPPEPQLQDADSQVLHWGPTASSFCGSYFVGGESPDMGLRQTKGSRPHHLPGLWRPKVAIVTKRRGSGSPLLSPSPTPGSSATLSWEAESRQTSDPSWSLSQRSCLWVWPLVGKGAEQDSEAVTLPARHLLPHSSFTSLLGGRHYHPQFTDN